MIQVMQRIRVLYGQQIPNYFGAGAEAVMGSDMLAQCWRDCKCSCVGSLNHLWFSTGCASGTPRVLLVLVLVGYRSGGGAWLKAVCGFGVSCPVQLLSNVKMWVSLELPLIWGWCDFHVRCILYKT